MKNKLPKSSTPTSERLPGEQQIVSVRAKVVFGNPNSNCSGTGICQISINDWFAGEPAPPDCRCLREVAASIQRIQDDKIRIVISGDLITEHLRPLFRTDRFDLPARYWLPKGVRQVLALQETFIPEGAYPIKKEGLSLAIDLPVIKSIETTTEK